MTKDDKRKDEIAQTRDDDATGRPKAVREAAEKRRKIDEIVRCLRRVMRTGDTRSFSIELKQAGVCEGSDDWKKAWDVYRDSLRRK